MKHFLIVPSVGLFLTLGACTQIPEAESDDCGASKYQSLVGAPSQAAMALDIPDDSRHYGSEERVAKNTASRLNFVHSGTAFDAAVDPSSTITEIFCG